MIRICITLVDSHYKLVTIALRAQKALISKKKVITKYSYIIQLFRKRNRVNNKAPNKNSPYLFLYISLH